MLLLSCLLLEENNEAACVLIPPQTAVLGNGIDKTTTQFSWDLQETALPASLSTPFSLRVQDSLQSTVSFGVSDTFNIESESTLTLDLSIRSLQAKLLCSNWRGMLLDTSSCAEVNLTVDVVDFPVIDGVLLVHYPATIVWSASPVGHLSSQTVDLLLVKDAVVVTTVLSSQVFFTLLASVADQSSAPVSSSLTCFALHMSCFSILPLVGG